MQINWWHLLAWLFMVSQILSLSSYSARWHLEHSEFSTTSIALGYTFGMIAYIVVLYMGGFAPILQ